MWERVVCSSHTIEGGLSRIGRSLAGVRRRKAGSLKGAGRSQGVRDPSPGTKPVPPIPRVMDPGTSMTIAVPCAADRASIVADLTGLPAAS